MFTSSREIITPDQAREYLKYNTHNRPEKPIKIRAYAEDMRNGAWRFNGEAIKFGRDEDGEVVLLDGQNRLLAIIQADVPVEMLVMWGLHLDDQDVMDQGAVRRLPDMLALRGETSAVVLATSIRAVFRWLHTPDPTHRQLGGSGQDARYISMATTSKLLKFFNENADDMRAIAREAGRLRGHLPVPVSVLAPLVMEFASIDADDAADFWHRLEKGLPSPRNLGDNDPLSMLSVKLRQMASGTGKQRYTPTEIAAVLVKGWNAYRKGVAVGQYKWASGGAVVEVFPQAI